METTTHKSNAKDFFLQLGAVITLYWATGQVLSLLLTVINKAFPKVNEYSNFGYSGSISFPVASLIVVFPLYVFLNYFIEKECLVNPEKRELSVRKWLTYITLFLSAGTLAGSLIYVIYLFLDGQDITTAFLLKALAWSVVSGMIFGYYIEDIRGKHTNQSRKVWTGVATLLVIGSILFGFMVIGSPRTQRLQRYDNQKVSDIQLIQNRISDHWSEKRVLPATLADLSNTYSYASVPRDSQTNTDYVYTIKSGTTYELCAVFNRDSDPNSNTNRYSYDNLNLWTYKKGNYCFEKTIDVNTYPMKKEMGI